MKIPRGYIYTRFIFKKWERKDEMVTLGGTVALKHIFSDSFDVVPEHF